MLRTSSLHFISCLVFVSFHFRGLVQRRQFQQLHRRLPEGFAFKPCLCLPQSLRETGWAACLMRVEEIWRNPKENEEKIREISKFPWNFPPSFFKNLLEKMRFLKSWHETGLLGRVSLVLVSDECVDGARAELRGLEVPEAELEDLCLGWTSMRLAGVDRGDFKWF